MIGVAYHYRGTADPEFSFDTWRFEAAALGVDLIIIVDESKYKNSHYFKPNGIVKETYLSLEAAEQAHTAIDWVYLEMAKFVENPVSLYEFEHPTDAIYVVGSNISGISRKGREDRTWVSIPMKQDQMVYSRTAMSIALYDRRFKEWQLR